MFVVHVMPPFLRHTLVLRFCDVRKETNTIEGSEGRDTKRRRKGQEGGLVQREIMTVINPINR